MDIAPYLERIGYTGTPTANEETLRALHRAHMLAVPFENLNIMLKRPIDLSESALYHKIVENRRGGFCYELNGMFAALLRQIGFQVDFLSAGVWMGEGFSPEFDHMALLVHLDEDWLADVGFGDCFVEPLRFVADEEQTVSNGTYRLVQREDHRWLLQAKHSDGTWANEYHFATTPYLMADFEPRCAWQQTPESHFTKRRICSRATPEGRITISDHRLIVTRHGEKEELQLGSEATVKEALQEHFGVDLDLM